MTDELDLAEANAAVARHRHKTMWAIVAKWDSSNIAAGPARTRTDAINAFMFEWKDQYASWSKAKAAGWVVLQAKVTWFAP